MLFRVRLKNFFVASIAFYVVLIQSGCGEADKKSNGSEARGSETRPIFTSPQEQQLYLADLLRFRAEKDSFLRAFPRSPIKKEDRRTFRHLNYYEPNPKFVVMATLTRNVNPPHITITTTTGSSRDALKHGILEFVLLGQKHRLAVYKFTDQLDGDPNSHLFVPFTDSTSGRETYGAGRYLDLDENETGEHILDFNRAYNPYCAYNEDYSCPIPPQENRLSTAITAGEKKFH